MRSSTVLLLAVSLIAPAAARADGSTPSAAEPLPAELVVPAPETLAFSTSAVGVQIYQCTKTADRVAWTFTAPEADLFGDDKKKVGTHGAGPNWADAEGSVVGTLAAKVPAPEATNIPWLRLTAASHTGTGRFAKVTSVQRVATVGGVAPTSGCDASHIGEKVRVPYQARYNFFARKNQN